MSKNKPKKKQLNLQQAHFTEWYGKYSKLSCPELRGILKKLQAMPGYSLAIEIKILIVKQLLDQKSYYVK